MKGRPIVQVSVLGSLNDGSVDEFVQQINQYREEGFTRVWLPQTPHELDLLTILAVALREVEDIQLGSAVVQIQVQHPMLLAQRALTLSTISGGRFTLGIGLTHQAVTEGMWGIPYNKPVRRLNDYLDGLLPLLAGQEADAVGETVTTRGVVVIPNAPAPDVYIAALGPQLLNIAGRRTKGTVTWMTGPKTLAERVGPALREAAIKAGRSENEVRVAAVLPVAVTDDVTDARAQAAEQFAMYGYLPSYRVMLDLEGYPGPEDAALIGDEATVSGRIDELRAAGVDEFVGIAFDASPDNRARTRALIRRHDGPLGAGA
jgi:5,10-methylenetetrahydromethanopterin reductase